MSEVTKSEDEGPFIPKHTLSYSRLEFKKQEKVGFRSTNIKNKKKTFSKEVKLKTPKEPKLKTHQKALTMQHPVTSLLSS